MKDLEILNCVFQHEGSLIYSTFLFRDKKKLKTNLKFAKSSEIKLNPVL